MFKAGNAFNSTGWVVRMGRWTSPRFKSSSSKNLARAMGRTFATLPAALDIFNLFNQELMPSIARSVSPGFDGRCSLCGEVGHQQHSMIDMDIKETDKAYEIIADVPGVDKKDINVSVRDNQLVISAVRSDVKKEESDSYRCIERSSGLMSRSFYLPHHVHSDKIEAKSENGVLHVTIPKSEEHPEDDAKKIEVQ